MASLTFIHLSASAASGPYVYLCFPLRHSLRCPHCSADSKKHTVAVRLIDWLIFERKDEERAKSSILNSAAHASSYFHESTHLSRWEQPVIILHCRTRVSKASKHRGCWHFVYPHQLTQSSWTSYLTVLTWLCHHNDFNYKRNKCWKKQIWPQISDYPSCKTKNASISIWHGSKGRESSTSSWPAGLRVWYGHCVTCSSCQSKTINTFPPMY